MSHRLAVKVVTVVAALAATLTLGVGAASAAAPGMTHDRPAMTHD